jgi:PAS domain S-box-containing protein
MGSDPAATEVPAHEQRVLMLPTTSADALAMSKLFAANRVISTTCADMTQLCAQHRDGAGALILAEEALLANPEELVTCVAAQPVWSDIPIIVLSRSGRETASLLDLIGRLGNVSVVERPIRTSTLITLVRSSIRARRRQYEVREYLQRQEEAQKTIREGERRYRSLIDNITDYAIFMTDPQGRISTWNGGAEALFGYTAAEVIDRTLDLFSTQEDIDSRKASRELTLAVESGRVASDGWKMRKDGTLLFIEGACVTVLDESGQLVGVAHFLRDVTEKHRIATEREQLLESERAARSDAERASRTKDEFLATLSHELRTPLNAVLGWTMVLRKLKSLPDEAANALNVIERNARSQAQIIADLLDMSSIISGKVRLDVQRTDLASIITATVETVRPATQAKNIRLQVVLDPMAGPVRGDPNRLQQVLWNLLTNAVKFTHKDGRVTITLARVNSHLEIEVIDNGEGIEPAFLPHMFDRFRQGDASTTRRHGGLGLGLSIVKQLVELHGGSISVKSAGRGMGATFRVVLPVMATAVDSTVPAEAREHPAHSVSGPDVEAMSIIDLTGAKVLVVDDEPDARLLIQRLLEDCHASVLTASSAVEALQVLGRDSVDVIVSDIGMPGEDGFSLIRRIRAIKDRNASTPAVALTAYARVEDRVKAIQAGFQMHLSKPVEPMELMTMVASLARRQGPAGE